MNFGLMRERAIFRPAPEHATPDGVANFFAEVFASLDERPRPLELLVDFSEAAPQQPIVIDLLNGEPVFMQEGGSMAHCAFARRWLAEHDVPLALPLKTRLILTPTSGNRVRVLCPARTI